MFFLIQYDRGDGLGGSFGFAREYVFRYEQIGWHSAARLRLVSDESANEASAIDFFFDFHFEWATFFFARKFAHDRFHTAYNFGSRIRTASGGTTSTPR